MSTHSQNKTSNQSASESSRVDIRYPEELPVSAKRSEIQALIEKHQVLIVCGETGSGKTTQLPKMCLELGRGQGKQSIVHTQPRRLAATSTAKRIAQELNSQIGELVGYKIRFQDKSDAQTAIKLVTDGILLAETQRDPLLKAYDTIIIDEAHERSLNIDFLLGYLKQVLPKRPGLKLIVTSATIDAERFASHFEDACGKPAPVIEVSGRLYPVEIRYKDPQEYDQKRKQAKQASKGKPSNQEQADEVDAQAFEEASLDAVDELMREGWGDILFFLPGEREIRDMADFFRKRLSNEIDILPLYARLTASDQEKVFRSGGRRRIVLATNVAETSLTVPGIHYVIDSGTARVKRYSYRNKVEMLQVERVSRASANQRAGRCGRVASGICIRLFSEEDFTSRPEFTDPEILRSSLASVILRMKYLRLVDVENFPFLQRPMGRAIADGYHLLAELNALTEEGQLTPIGKDLARLPMDPRIGRMLVEASRTGALHEVLVIAAGLSIQDPRERPHDAQEAADQAHLSFSDGNSDFITLLNIWNWYQKTKQTRESQRDLRNKLARKFLNGNRMREWSEVHAQLQSIAKEQGWSLNQTAATDEQIHLSLLCGLLGNIGCKHESDPVYNGARGIKFAIHPSSPLLKSAGKWIAVAELVETTRLYGRCVLKIRTDWLERVGKHLIKRNHSDPHWEKNTGQAVAFESGTIYGLPIYSKRRVSLANFNRQDARTIMITEGLVAGQVKTNLSFYQHNVRLIQEIEKLEHKARRQDILVDESLIAEFYDRQIPQSVFNQKSLENWCKTAPEEALNKLKLDKDDLLNRRVAGVSTEMYPKHTEHLGVRYELRYHFEPGSPRDGVTMQVPLLLLNQVNPVRCEWLVPGMVKDKALLLIKSLPQRLRRYCVPVPQYAEKFASECLDTPKIEKPFVEALRQHIAENTPARPTLADFRLESLPPHLFMNFKLVDEHGRQLDMQRSLSSLKAQWSKQAQEQFKQSVEVTQAKTELDDSKALVGKALGKDRTVEQTPSAPVQANEKITTWNLGKLPELLEIKKAGQVIYGYPALKDCGEHCELEVYDEEEMARRVHHKGLIRLYSLSFKENLKFLRKNLKDFQKVSMLYMPFGNADELRETWLALAIDRAALLEGWPTDEKSFLEGLAKGKPRLNLIAQEIGKVLLDIFNEYSTLSKKLQALSKIFPSVIEDIDAQMQWLLPKDFLLTRPYEQIKHYPRYIMAASIRLEKLRKSPDRDLQCMQDVRRLQMKWVKAQAQLRGFEDESLKQFAWQLQELRVGLFAQELKTPMPVSVKRLEKAWQAIECR